jgi:hypothetical protein
MGRLQAEEMKGQMDRDQAIRRHLLHNHYPPPPEYMIPVVKEAMEKAEKGELDALVKLPEGVRYRDGRTEVEAREIMKAFHLWDLMPDSEDDQ